MTQPEPTSQQLQDELAWQLRVNLELQAELDRSQVAPVWLPTDAWQLSLLQLALPPTPIVLPAFSDPRGWQARLRLAWLHLGAGEVVLAQALHAELLPHVAVADNALIDSLDLLGRVLATQTWLATTITPPAPQHSALPTSGLRMAVDSMQQTSCGNGLAITGWCIDPALQLASLIMLRGPQALPIPLAALQRHSRPDVDSHTAVGWRLVLALPPLLQPPPAPVLLVVLHNGDQFCLSLPPATEPLTWGELIAEPLAWPGLSTI